MSQRPAGPRIFSVEEANRLLPKVKALLQALRTQRESLRTLEETVAIVELEGLQGNGTLSATAQAKTAEQTTQWHASMETFQEMLSQLDTLGGQLKDLDEGLIDFFTVHQGQLVYLCWKDGEAAIRYWHPLEDGFSGRRPITELANN